MVGRMSRLAFAILGLALAVGAASARAQIPSPGSPVVDCPGTLVSWKDDVHMPAQYKNCTCPCDTCHPKCPSSSTPSVPISPGNTNLDPSQAFAVQLFGGFLNQLFSSAFSNNEPDPALVQQQIAEQQARLKQQQDRI